MDPDMPKWHRALLKVGNCCTFNTCNPLKNVGLLLAHDSTSWLHVLWVQSMVVSAILLTFEKMLFFRPSLTVSNHTEVLSEELWIILTSCRSGSHTNLQLNSVSFSHVHIQHTNKQMHTHVQPTWFRWSVIASYTPLSLRAHTVGGRKCLSVSVSDRNDSRGAVDESDSGILVQ